MKFYGSYNSDGSIKEWPELDIQGSPFERPATRYDLKDGRFVVLPQQFDASQIFQTLEASMEREAEFEAARRSEADRVGRDEAEEKARAKIMGTSTEPGVIPPAMVELTPSMRRARGTTPDDTDA